MKEIQSILDFANGEIITLINAEISKVIKNINNPNTDNKSRVIKIDIKLTPKNLRKTIDIDYSVNSKLRPENPVSTAVTVQSDCERILITEDDGIADGQLTITGEEHQQKFVEM